MHLAPRAQVWHRGGSIHKPSTHSFNTHLWGMCERHHDSGWAVFPVSGSSQPNGGYPHRAVWREHSWGTPRRCRSTVEWGRGTQGSSRRLSSQMGEPSEKAWELAGVVNSYKCPYQWASHPKRWSGAKSKGATLSLPKCTATGRGLWGAVTWIPEPSIALVRMSLACLSPPPPSPGPAAAAPAWAALPPQTTQEPPPSPPPLALSTVSGIASPSDDHAERSSSFLYFAQHPRKSSLCIQQVLTEELLSCQALCWAAEMREWIRCSPSWNWRQAHWYRHTYNSRHTVKAEPEQLTLPWENQRRLPEGGGQGPKPQRATVTKFPQLLLTTQPLLQS